MSSGATPVCYSGTSGPLAGGRVRRRWWCGGGYARDGDSTTGTAGQDGVVIVWLYA
ncbi:hypothetical protein QFZ55_007325 [Streptomyces luteogriseus]|uniref:hypothetical protein n=1 Tax=Streptomyces luteogriseus TaxID=68233 RepID=UPI0027836974|nr:hypothetical protein [Streptomyces luteogriseus]MDQ0717873.1 hypothetical protein [Streptomyces luteogriseus]